VSELFFIVGRGRSGTTLLSRILMRHPRLDVAPEGFFAMNLRRRYGAGPWDEARVERFCRDVVMENRMATWGLDLSHLADALRAELESPGEELDYRRACELVYRCYAQSAHPDKAPAAVGDKNPHYALLTSELCELFPTARFVHIVRDYRDNIASYRTVPFDVSDTAALAYRWVRYNREILRASAREPDRFVCIRYEDLLGRSEPTLTRVCEHLGVDYDPALLDFHEGGHEGFYGEGSPWFANLGKPLDAGQAEKWRQSMDDDDLRTADAICGELGAQLGYRPASSGARATARDRLGQLYGWASVAAERMIFHTLPAEPRIRLINFYRSLSGRV
jgi:hypothetical protein